MSEPPSSLPELPDTSNPFELLGVRAGSDAVEIKRAYVQLIKVYRPERAPEEFQRIHAAYESALKLTEAGFAVALWGRADEEEEVDEGWSSETEESVATEAAAAEPVAEPEEQEVSAAPEEQEVSAAPEEREGALP
jgi:hypothetical protein